MAHKIGIFQRKKNPKPEMEEVTEAIGHLLDYFDFIVNIFDWSGN